MSVHAIATRLSVLFIGALSIAVLAACNSSESTSGGGTGGATATGGSGGSTATGGSGGMMMPETTDPSAETQAVWAQIADYDTWPTFTENATPVKSLSHMEMYVVTYHNAVVTDAIANKTLPLPDGSIMVKENFMMPDDPMPMAVTVMAKQNGAWYWIEAMPDGKVILDAAKKPLEGDVAMCTGCHMGASTNDMVFTHDFTK